MARARCAADERDVEAGDGVDGRVAGDPPQGAQDRKANREDDRRDRHADREGDPAQEQRGVLRDEIRVNAPTKRDEEGEATHED